MLNKIKKLLKSPRSLTILALAIIAICAVVYLLAIKASKSPEPASQNPTNEQKINYDPATEEDLQRSEENKRKIVDRQEQEDSNQTNSAGTKKSVTPIITYAGQYDQSVEVGGYINGIFEDGGMCTASFKKGSQTVTKAVQSLKNANAVDCPAMVASTNELDSGKWTVTISYTSQSATGTSSERKIEVR